MIKTYINIVIMYNVFMTRIIAFMPILPAGSSGRDGELYISEDYSIER